MFNRPSLQPFQTETMVWFRCIHQTSEECQLMSLSILKIHLYIMLHVERTNAIQSSNNHGIYKALGYTTQCIPSSMHSMRKYKILFQ